MATIHVLPASAAHRVEHTQATFHIELHGFRLGQRVKLSFWETPMAGKRQPRELGSVAGMIVPTSMPWSGRFTIRPDGPPPAKPAPSASGRSPLTVGFKLDPPSNPGQYAFAIDDAMVDRAEGDQWEIKVKLESAADGLRLESPGFPIAHYRRAISRRLASYDWHEGNTVKFYHDGSTDERGSDGAFKDMLDAIASAEHFVFLAGWSFHPMFCPTKMSSLDDTIGKKLIDLARTKTRILIAIHTWDHTWIGSPDSQNDSGDDLLDNLAEGERPENLLWRVSSHDRTGYSHHQKYLIVDSAGPGKRRGITVFFGGLDMTAGRFDWPKHPILPVPDERPAGSRFTVELPDPGGGETTYSDWYNAEFKNDRHCPRQPWHDVHARLHGPAAWDFVREFVGRWNVDPSLVPGARGNNTATDNAAVLGRFWELHDADRFVQQWEPTTEQPNGHGGGWVAQVYRSMPKRHWGPAVSARKGSGDAGKPSNMAAMPHDFRWDIDNPEFEMSIQHAYRQAITQAENFICIETQYFIGSGELWHALSSGGDNNGVENTLPELIATRIIERHWANKPFHVYIVMPMFPEGDPVADLGVAQRQYEWHTMEGIVLSLRARIGDAWSKYISFCFMANWDKLADQSNSGSRNDRVRRNRRYLVYVHSKMMIVDDRYILLGSANLNERGLAGNRDLEIACGLWPAFHQEATCVEDLRRFRKDIWLEYFHQLPTHWQNPGSIECVTEVRKKADDNFRALHEQTRPANAGFLCRLPLVIKGFKDPRIEIAVESASSPGGPDHLPDSVYNEGSERARQYWEWGAPGPFWSAYATLAQ